MAIIRRSGKYGVQVEERFWTKVEKMAEDGCWFWLGAPDKAGYGRVGFNRKDYYAHRLSYEFAHGEIPEGLEIDHLCKNTLCVNPEHLEAVSHAENVRRGDGWAGRYAQKTHCPQGHPYVYENLEKYWLKRGRRRCLTCKNARELARYHRKRQAA